MLGKYPISGLYSQPSFFFNFLFCDKSFWAVPGWPRNHYVALQQASSLQSFCLAFLIAEIRNLCHQVCWEQCLQRHIQATFSCLYNVRFQIPEFVKPSVWLKLFLSHELRWEERLETGSRLWDNLKWRTLVNSLTKCQIKIPNSS